MASELESLSRFGWNAQDIEWADEEEILHKQLLERYKSWDESKHPRGQPENAGQFVESGGVGGVSSKDSAKDSTKKQEDKRLNLVRGAATQSQDFRTVKLDEIADNTRLRPGNNMNVVHVVKLNDGQKYSFKPIEGEGDPDDMYEPFIGVSQASREVAASIVDEEMGLNMTAGAVMADLHDKRNTRGMKANVLRGSFAKWVNDTAMVAAEHRWYPLVGIEGLPEMVWFDLLIGNGDRHYGNWLIKDNQAVLIDNGMSFGTNDQYAQYIAPFKDLVNHNDLLKQAQASVPKKIMDGIDRLIANKDRVVTRLKGAGLDYDQIESFYRRALYIKTDPSLNLSSGSYEPHKDIALRSRPIVLEDIKESTASPIDVPGAGNQEETAAGIKSANDMIVRAKVVHADLTTVKAIETMKVRMADKDKDLESIRKAVIQKWNLAKNKWDHHLEVAKAAEKSFESYYAMPETTDAERAEKLRYADHELHDMAENLHESFRAANNAKLRVTSKAHEMIFKRIKSSDHEVLGEDRLDGGPARHNVEHVGSRIVQDVDIMEKEGYGRVRNFLANGLVARFAYGMNKVRIGRIPADVKDQRSYHIEQGETADGKVDNLKQEWWGSRLMMARDAGDPTMVHEFGHAMETMPEVGKLARAFLASRVHGEGYVRLAERYPDRNYKDYEIGSEDEFRKTFGDNGHYVGKFYNHGATEIMSMGMEQMYRDPVLFAKQDPEYFKFVVGIMSGKLLDRVDGDKSE